MKKTLTTGQAASKLLDDVNADWSYNGTFALIEWLEELEDDTETEIEFDPVAFRGDFVEYKSAVAACEEYDLKPEGDDEEEREENALDLLRKKTTVIEFDGGVIIQAY